MRRGVAAVLLFLLLFNISYSLIREEEFNPPRMKNPGPILNSVEGEGGLFNLTPPGISESYQFRTTLYSTLKSLERGVNLTYISRSTGTLRVVGYATREDSQLMKTPSLMIEERTSGRRETYLITPGRSAESSGDFQTTEKRYLRLEDLNLFRVEVHQNYVGEGGRMVEEDYTLFPSSTTPRTLWPKVLTKLHSIRVGSSYSINLTLELYPLPIPPVPFNFVLTVEAIHGEVAQLYLHGDGAGVKVSGEAEVSARYHYPLNLNLTARGRINGYNLLINFRKECTSASMGSGELLRVPPFGGRMDTELLPGGLLPSSGSNFNRSLYGATPEEVEDVVRGFFSEWGLQVLNVKGVQIALNNSARPSWNLTVDTDGGQYFAEIDPDTLTVVKWGEDTSIYLGECELAEKRLTFSSYYEIMGRAAPDGFFTINGEPNPTLKIYLYQAPPLLLLTPPLPFPTTESYYLSIATNPKDPSRIIFFCTDAFSGNILAEGSFEGQILK